MEFRGGHTENTESLSKPKFEKLSFLMFRREFWGGWEILLSKQANEAGIILCGTSRAFGGVVHRRCNWGHGK
jgi:hypothetical protein